MQLKWIKTLFSNNCFFYCEEVYKLSKEGFELTEEGALDNSHFPCLIIGREHYTEQVQQFPVKDKKELERLISHSMEGPYLYAIEERGDASTKVVIWSVDKSFFERFGNKLMIWIPESFFFNGVIESQLIRAQRPHRELFIATGSSMRTVPSEGLYKNPDYFLLSIGIAEEGIQHVNMAQPEYAQFIRRKLGDFGIVEWLQILSRQGYSEKLWSLASWRSVFAGAVLAFVLLNGINFFFLKYQNTSIDNAIEELDVRHAIELRNAVSKKNQLLASLSQVASSAASEETLWHMLLTCMDAGADVQFVRSTPEELEVRFEADKATDILSLLRQHSGVENAEFSTPVRESVGRERFTISMTLSAVGPSQGDAT
ncbi:hypothetical protein [Lacimicrobium sp. SS2-24]|uniref:hypothetical protein n=1 Tax=Lacimicrobium sp. SS2-24 TaxID=2005569 RepID=UPI000B4AB6BC|nr:hypothetical protein [Lacimicrobium sp. SS2-24]